MNQYGQLTIVVPFRPGSRQAPYAVNVRASPTNGLDKDRFLDVGQIRAVNNQRLLGQLGVLEEHYWQQVRAALDIVLGFTV
jgi:mRNA interferase MazF